MEFSWNPNTRCAEKPQSSISTHPFSDAPSCSKRSKLTGLQPLSFKISLRDTSFHIFLNPLGFYLSRMLVEFSLTCIFQHVRKKIYGVNIPRKSIEYIHLYSYPSPQLKTPGTIFWKSVSPNTKQLEEAMIFSIKIQSEYMKMTWNISLFTFCMICNFPKCDDFTVLWIISIK